MTLTNYKSNPENNLLNAILKFIPLHGVFNIHEILRSNSSIEFEAFPDFKILEDPNNPMGLPEKIALKNRHKIDTINNLISDLDKLGFIERHTGHPSLTDKGRKLREAGSYDKYLRSVDELKEKEEYRHALEEENLIATTSQAKQAIKDSKFAKLMAWAALILSIITLIVTIVFEMKNK